MWRRSAALFKIPGGAAAILSGLALLWPRPDLLGLARHFDEIGDVRNMRKIAREIIRRPDLPLPEFDAVSDVALRHYESWNSTPPRWETDLLDQWARRHNVAQSLRWEKRREPVPVDFVFKSSPGRFGKLFLEGGWDESGALADLSGWKAIPLRPEGGGGTWGTRLKLHRTRQRNLYHAVVRTAPWPSGAAVGAVNFAVPGPCRVEALERKDLIPEFRERRAFPGSSKIGVSVLVVDGATWHLILPWVHAGFLPHFARLLKEGAAANLTSCPLGPGPAPYPSEQNIYSALTGVLPYRHGMRKGLGVHGIASNTNLPRRAAPLWVMASEEGRRSAVVGVLNGFPPDRIIGELVPRLFFAAKIGDSSRTMEIPYEPDSVALAGLFGVSAERIGRIAGALGGIGRIFHLVYPSSLRSELDRLLPPPTLSARDGILGLARSLDLYSARTADLLAAKDYHDLLVAYDLSVDVASHLHWSGVEPALGSGGAARPDAARGPVWAAYERADEWLGRLMAVSRHLVVFSDHGFGAMPRDVAVEVLNVLRLMRAARQDMDLLSEERLQYEPAPPGSRVAGGWTVWFGRGGADSAARFGSYLRRSFYEPGKEPLFADISLRRRNSQWGVRFGVAALPSHYAALRLGGRRREPGDLLERILFRGQHVGNGILALWGPKIKPGVLSAGAYITDIAPTALYLCGLPAGKDMDGRLLREAILPQELAARPPRAIPSYGSGGSGWLRLLAAVRWRSGVIR